MKKFLIILAFLPFSISLLAQQSVLSSFNGYGDIVNVIDVDPTDSLFTIDINNFYGSPRFQPYGPWIAQDVQVGMVMWVDCARFVITNVNSASFSTMSIDVKVPSVDWNLGVATPLPNSRCAVVYEDQYLLTALPAPADGNSGALSGINNTLFACMLNHYSQALLVTKNSVNEITDYVAGLDTIPSEAPGPNIGETWRNSVGQLFYSDGTQWLTDKEIKFSNIPLEGLPSYLYKLGIDTLGQDTLYISNNGTFKRFQSGLVYKEGYGINIFATDSIEVDTNQIATLYDISLLPTGIDTFQLNNDTLKLSLVNDFEPFKKVILPVVGINSGTGISTSSTSGIHTITNTAPDQIVSITGAGISNVTGTYPNFTVTSTEVDGSTTNELQTLSTLSNTVTLSNSGGSFTIAGAGINTVGTVGSTITVTGTEVDGSISNEGILGVGAGSATSSTILSNTSTSTPITLNAAGIISITETVSSNGGSITLTGTEVDGSITNEIQDLSLSGQTLSLSSDPTTVTLPVIGITAGTGISTSSTSGNFTITNTGDLSNTNELQQIDTFRVNGANLELSLQNDNQSVRTVPLSSIVTSGGGLTGNGVVNYLSQYNTTSTLDTTGIIWVGGRMGIGTASPTATLGVNGTFYFGGSGTIRGNGGDPFTVRNSSNAIIYRYADDGRILLGSGSPFPTIGVIDRSSFATSVTGGGIAFTVSENTAGSDINFGGTSTITSGDLNNIRMGKSFSPTSGNANYSIMRIAANINQTGGANGIVRGLHITPSLASAPNFRSIDWENNIGFGLYGAGTAPNYVNGNLLLGNLINNARLRVQGSGTTTGTFGLIVTSSDTTTSSATLVVRDDKRVGIGTNAPTDQLHTTGSVRLQNYPNTLNTTGNPVNVLSTGTDGILQSHPISEVISAGGAITSITGGTGISVSTVSGASTITNTAPDQTVSITGAGINTVSGTYPNFTITGTEVDGSTTNELQTLSTGTNTLTLSNGGGTVTVDTDPSDDVTGSGASDNIPRFTGTQIIGNSQINDNGNIIRFGTNTTFTDSATKWRFPSATSSDARLGVYTTTGLGLFFGVNSLYPGLFSGTYIPGTFTPTSIALNQFGGGVTIGAAFAPNAALNVRGSGTSSSTWTAQFHNSAGNNNALMIRDDGNVGIGTSSPGAKLQINGSGNTNTTTSLTIQNSDGVSLLRVRDDLYTSINYLRVGNSFSTSTLVFPFVTNSGVPDAAGTNLSFYNYTGSNSAVGGAFAFAGNNFIQTSGSHVFFRFSHNFFPTSGNATYSAFTIRPSITQSGGANGITRGFHVDPILGSAADWRSIEWSNNTGYGLYGTGTANNYLGGSLGIGATTPSRTLHVAGEARITDLTTDTPTRIVGADTDGDLGEITLGSGLSITSGVLNTSSTLNTGSGTSGQVTFWNGTNSITGSNNLWWDNTNARLGIGTSTPSRALSVASDADINNLRVGKGNNSLNNIVIGTGAALNSITTGEGNVAIGSNSLRVTTTGQNNSAIGVNTLWANTTGTGNVAIGPEAMFRNKTGNNNVAIGTSALNDDDLNDQVVAIGQNALLSARNSDNTVAIGTNAARLVSAGGLNKRSQFSIFLGFDTRPLDSLQINQIVIGYEGRGLGSNTTRIGNTSTVQTHLDGRLTVGNTLYDANTTARIVGLNTTASTYALVVTNSTAGTNTTSDPALVVTNTQNVGIGTYSPQKTLHVTGEVRISDLDNGVATRIVGATADGDLDELAVGSGLNITSGTISVTNPISASEVFIESSTSTTIDLDANAGVVKDVNGTNASFTYPTDLSRLSVYKNGIRLSRTGSLTTRDFSVNTTTNEITFSVALVSTDRIVIVKI